MEKAQFPHKMVAVLNKSIEPHKLMNALAHMCIGLGSVIERDHLRLSEYRDSLGGIHPFISEMPFIVLSENSNKIRKLRQEALIQTILFADFTDTMTIGSYQDQIARTAQVPESDLIYYGIVMFGEWETITSLTKKASLYKG